MDGPVTPAGVIRFLVACFGLLLLSGLLIDAGVMGPELKSALNSDAPKAVPVGGARQMLATVLLMAYVALTVFPYRLLLSRSLQQAFTIGLIGLLVLFVLRTAWVITGADVRNKGLLIAMSLGFILMQLANLWALRRIVGGQRSLWVHG